MTPLVELADGLAGMAPVALGAAVGWLTGRLMVRTVRWAIDGFPARPETTGERIARRLAEIRGGR